MILTAILYSREVVNEPDWHGGIVLLVVLVLIFIVLATIVIHHYTKHYLEDSHANRAIDIAERRYAKGLIDKKEFDQIKKDLS